MDRPGRTSRRPPRPVDPRQPRGWRRSRPSNGPTTAPTVTSGRATAPRRPRAHRARTRPALIGSVSAGLEPWPRTSIVRQWNPAAWRKTAFGSVRSRADSQPWTRATPGPGWPPRAGMNQAGSSRSPGADGGRLEGQPEVGRSDLGRVLARVPGARSIGEREAVGQAERRRGDGRGESGSTHQSHVR